MKASRFGGQLETINNCYLWIPNESAASSDGAGMKIQFQGLPVVTDGKSAKYDPTPVIGRATEILTYANSSARTLNIELPFFVTKTSGNDIGTVQYNLAALRAIASATYPRPAQQSVPYVPPVVCLFKYGSFLSIGAMCVIIDKYSVKNDPAVPSDPVTLCPYKFTVSVSLIKVYSSNDLPDNVQIWNEGV